MTDHNQLASFNTQAKQQIGALKQETETLEREIGPTLQKINENKSKIEVLEKYLAISGNQRPGEGDEHPIRRARFRRRADGRTVGDVAVKVLEHNGEPMHYTDIMHRMKYDESFTVGGQDPKGNMLAHLANDERIIRTGKGIYGLREWREEASEQSEGS